MRSRCCVSAFIRIPKITRVRFSGKNGKQYLSESLFSVLTTQQRTDSASGKSIRHSCSYSQSGCFDQLAPTMLSAVQGRGLNDGGYLTLHTGKPMQLQLGSFSSGSTK